MTRFPFVLGGLILAQIALLAGQLTHTIDVSLWLIAVPMVIALLPFIAAALYVLFTAATWGVAAFGIWSAILLGYE